MDGVFYLLRTIATCEVLFLRWDFNDNKRTIILWFERQGIESHWFIGLLNLQLSVQSVIFMNSSTETLPNETVLKYVQLNGSRFTFFLL